jgi:malate dehydrogenase (oxaloacetate-decarboxylating)(NADP+)
MIAGIVGRFDDIAGRVLPVIGLAPGCEVAATLGALHSEQGTFFICDTHVNVDPSAEQLAEIAEMAVDKLSLFGIEPRVALVSHSAFGTHDDASARKMRATLALLRERLPEVQMEGEMPADMALDAEYRARVFPNSRLEGPANLLVMPDIEAARIAFNFGRVIGRSVTVGPMLLGAARPAHILSPSATVRRVVNMTALTVVEAQRLGAAEELKS